MSARRLYFYFLLALPVAAMCAGCERSGSSVSSAQDGAAPPPLPRKWASHAMGLPFLLGYQKGLDAAKEANKPVMFFVTATWCGWCKKLARESFTDARIRKLLENFVLVIVDGDTEREARRELGAAGFPHIVFQSSSGKTLAVCRGYRPASEFLETVELALSAANRP